MKIMYPGNWPQFFTATIQGWNYLLQDDRYKIVIINCLHYLVKNNRVKINAFVIMSNHIHLIWQATAGNNLVDVQTSFKKFTSQQFLKLLLIDEKMAGRLVRDHASTKDEKFESRQVGDHASAMKDDKLAGRLVEDHASGKLNAYQVNAADRKHHFWKRNSLGIELFTAAVFVQKLNYIHDNPVRAGICSYASAYRYSSAVFYEKHIDEFCILEHYL